MQAAAAALSTCDEQRVANHPKDVPHGRFDSVVTAAEQTSLDKTTKWVMNTPDLTEGLFNTYLMVLSKAVCPASVTAESEIPPTRPIRSCSSRYCSRLQSCSRKSCTGSKVQHSRYCITLWVACARAVTAQCPRDCRIHSLLKTLQLQPQPVCMMSVTAMEGIKP